MLIYMYPPRIVSEGKHRIAHLSIDDCRGCYIDLIKHQNEYQSVFNQPFFCFLRKMHDEYDVKFTLYSYYMCNDSLNITMIPSDYKKELKNNSDWLTISFHAVYAQDNKPTNVSTEEFIEAYNRFCIFTSEINGGGDLLRLDFFYAKPDMVDSLKARGVKILLAADDERISYDLSEEQNSELLFSNSITIDGITYMRSNVRIEKVLEPYWNLYENMDKDTLVVFTHEWALDRVNRYKLERFIELLKENNYTFIN